MLKGKRTVLFNVLGLLAAIVGGVQFNEWIGEYAPHLIGMVALANIVLRALTTTPIGKAPPLSLKKQWRKQRFGMVLLCASLALAASVCNTLELISA